MRISAKGRYAIAATIEISRQAGEGDVVSVLQVAGSLGISKIYLEQVLPSLKKSGVIRATKGAKGGYQLAKPPAHITLLDILGAVETGLFEPSEQTVQEQAPELEASLQSKVFAPLDRAVSDLLAGISVQDLLDDIEKRGPEQYLMMHI